MDNLQQMIADWMIKNIHKFYEWGEINVILLVDTCAKYFEIDSQSELEDMITDIAYDISEDFQICI